MQHEFNVVGKGIAKFRRQRGWTIEDLVAKLELIGCRITPEILTDIETGLCVASDAQMFLFSEVFRVPIKDLSNRLAKAAAFDFILAVWWAGLGTPRVSKKAKSG